MKRAKLIRLRKQAGLSQLEVATCLNKDISTYQRIEYGRVALTDADLIRLCDFFRCHPDCLIEDQGYLSRQRHARPAGTAGPEQAFMRSILQLLADREQKFLHILRSLQHHYSRRSCCMLCLISCGLW